MFQFLPEHRRLNDISRHNATRRPAICEQALPRTELRATTQDSAEPPQLSQPSEQVEAVPPTVAFQQAQSPGSQEIVEAAFAKSRDRVSTARRLFQRCRHLSDLGGVLKHLPHDCRGTTICCEAYLHAARLHEGIKRYRKRNNKVFSRTMGLLCDMTTLNSAMFSLQDLSTISTALIRLRGEGTAACKPIGAILANAAPLLTAAASSGRKGSLDAAQHAPALLLLLAEYQGDIAEEDTEAVAAAAMLLIDKVADRVKPDVLATTLCALPAPSNALYTRALRPIWPTSQQFSSVRPSLFVLYQLQCCRSSIASFQTASKCGCSETAIQVLVDRASHFHEAKKLSASASAEIANALTHLQPPQLRLAGHLAQAALPLPTEASSRPPPPAPTTVLLNLAECHAAAAQHAAERAKTHAAAQNPAVTAAAAHITDALCRSAHLLTIPELSRALCAVGGLPISTSLRRRFAHSALCCESRDVAPRCTVHQCLDLLTALNSLRLPAGDPVADMAAEGLVQQSVSLRAPPAVAASLLRELGTLQFSAQTDSRARSVSAFCERVRRPWDPPVTAGTHLDALRGLAGVRTSWQSALKSRRAAQLISALLPLLGELPAEALADAAEAVGQLKVATHVRATFLVALEARLPQEQLQRLPPRTHVRLLRGLAGIACASTPFHVEAGRASRQMADVPAPEEVSPQPPSAALFVLVERVAPCVKVHALSAAELTVAVEALARLEAPPSHVSPLLYAAVGAAEEGFSSLDPDSTLRLIHGLAYFADVVRLPASFFVALDSHLVACVPSLSAAQVAQVSIHWPRLVSYAPPGWAPRRGALACAATASAAQLLHGLEPFEALQLAKAVSRLSRDAPEHLESTEMGQSLHRGQLGEWRVDRAEFKEAVLEYARQRVGSASEREFKWIRVMCSVAGVGDDGELWESSE